MTGAAELALPAGQVIPLDLLPVNAADEPDKVGPVQTAGTQPDAMSVPAQHLEAGAGLVAENKGGFVLPAQIQSFEVLGQGINGQAMT